MYIRMTIIAFSPCFCKNQAFMTESAVDLSMLSFKRQLGGTMIKRIDILVNLPSFCAVTGTATDFKSRTMRGFGLHPEKQQQWQQDQK
jgi:hypothetical protein